MQPRDVSNVDPNRNWSTDDRTSGRFGITGGQLGGHDDHQSGPVNGRIAGQQSNAFA